MARYAPHKVTIAFDANKPGLWAFPCQFPYHMHTGMFQTVRYI